MYLPAHFAENRTEVLHGLMNEYPLATLILQNDRLEANHIPLQLHAPTEQAPLGILQGHVARANPMWKTARHETPALAIFQGPQAYISPAWYASKSDHAKVVPTWNYVVVHARGRLVVKDDAAWLREFLTGLTNTHETEAGSAWSIDDAPADYIAKMLASIVGFEITITELQGKWKVSQNKSVADRAGMVTGLTNYAEAHTKPRGNSQATAVAELISKVHPD